MNTIHGCARRGHITKENRAWMNMNARCLYPKLGFEYVETASAGKSVFSFPGQTYPVAMDILRCAAMSAKCGRASLAIAKDVRFTK